MLLAKCTESTTIIKKNYSWTYSVIKKGSCKYTLILLSYYHCCIHVQVVLKAAAWKGANFKCFSVLLLGIFFLILFDYLILIILLLILIILLLCYSSCEEFSAGYGTQWNQQWWLETISDQVKDIYFFFTVGKFTQRFMCQSDQNWTYKINVNVKSCDWNFFKSH